MAMGKLNVADTLADGDLRASLERLRDRLAQELDIAAPCCECDRSDGRVIATLTKELAAILARIDALPAPEGASRIDELANARKARQGAHRRADSADAAPRPAVSE